MKPESIARIVAIAFVVLSLGFVEYGLSHHRAAMLDLAAFQEKRTLLNSGIKQAKAKIEADNRERGRLQAGFKKSPPALGSSAEGTRRNTTMALISASPKLLDLSLRNFRANLNQRFGVFYWLAGLSPQQIAKFEDLESKYQEAAIDLAATAAAQGVADTDPAIASMRAQQNDQFQADQIGLLGAAGFQQLQQFNNAQGALALVNGSGYLALGAGDAYTYEQAGQLMQIMADASPAYQQGGSFDPKSVDWDSVVAQAANVLSPPQLNALKAQAQAMTLVTRLLPGYFAQQSGK